ncbi:hypothetical protein N9A94_03655 [Akkermansiaceae bacterium]|nr:hypothetical protein [Akkermansiaceae bacterium]
MLLQSPNLVVYRARGRNGFRYAITRFIFPKSVLANLREACFEASLMELKRLNHGCLRPVIDGGLDDVDGMPWIARVWWDGEYLVDRMHEGVLTPNDIQRLADHGEALIDALGDRAAAISFRARDVILTSGRGGQPVETFNIDAQKWFRDWAMGIAPGGGMDARVELSNLVTEAENSEMAPPMMAEEEAASSRRQLVMAPAPPPTQILVAKPPATQSLIPQPTPSQYLVPQPPPSQPLIPQPTPSQYLVQQPTPSQLLVQQEPVVANKLIFERPGQGRRLQFR